MTQNSHSAQVVYLSHGGGPMPILGDTSHLAMISFMQQLPNRIKKPDAIVVISAHWEEKIATLTSAISPMLEYDYYGFPAAAYQITYPVQGNPLLAARIVSLLQTQQIAATLAPNKGLDHGVFIPLKLMYPQADIPVIQLSLLADLNPTHHIALGKALHPLMTENILIIGSGFSFHNMRAFSWGNTPVADPQNDAFQNWLIEVCTQTINQEQREQQLINWQHAPFAHYCHPRAEHLLPLHVCAGIAQKQARLIFDDYIVGKRAVGFLW